MKSLPLLIVSAAFAIFAQGTVAQEGPVEIYAHRLSGGLYNENSLSGLNYSMKLGVDRLDVDVVQTQDNAIVVFHWPTLFPDVVREKSTGEWLNDETILVKNLTLSELQANYDVGRIRPGSDYFKKYPDRQPDDGARIETLRAFFEAAKSKNGGQPFPFQIEMKGSPEINDQFTDVATFCETIVETIKAENMVEHVVIHSFYWPYLLYLQEKYPEIALAVVTEETLGASYRRGIAWTAGHDIKDHNNSIITMVADLGFKTWNPRFDEIDAEQVDKAHQLGLRVIPWTPNTQDDMEKMLDIHVDGMITDYPERLRRLLDQRGMALPQPVSF